MSNTPVTAAEIIEMLDLCQVFIRNVKPDSPLLKSIPAMKERLEEIADAIDNAPTVRQHMANHILGKLLENHGLVCGLIEREIDTFRGLPIIALDMASQILDHRRIQVTDESEVHVDH